MEYLTTHDIAWINTVVTGEVLPFNYIALESAMAGQYRYGNSHDVLAQAATFLRRLLFSPPFAKGNRRTALIATLTFLNRNGYRTAVADEELVRILGDLERGVIDAHQAVEQMVVPAETQIQESLRAFVQNECLRHAKALQLALPGD